MSQICPICKEKNGNGETYCRRCGYQLSIAPVAPGELTLTQKAPAPKEPTTGVIVAATLRLSDGTRLPLPIKEKVIVGRGDPDNELYPDIDLTPCGGAAAGVSRQHVEIHSEADGKFRLLDLGAKNGTKVNGQPLAPQSSCPLKNGDEVTLGRLSIIFITLSDEEAGR
jgi:pSer/pThr/pTyr-binding forkhead associated (FHA) protein